MEKILRQRSDYFQPNFYHFSQDSILLAKLAAKELGDLPGNSWCLDIGAGCGVVGLEIIKALDKNINFDFLELQSEFRPFFSKNLDFIGERRKFCNFLNFDFRSFPDTRKYSVIVCNPPYFVLGSGMLGNDIRRNKCRFFMEGSYKELFIFLKSRLNPNGKAFILLRGIEKKYIETFEKFWKFEIIPLDKKTNLMVLSVLDINRN